MGDAYGNTRMALILLIFLGALLGWLVSIFARSETRSGILTDMGLGAAGALGGGILANHGSVLGGLSAYALLIALAAALAVLAIYNLIIRPNLRS